MRDGGVIAERGTFAEHMRCNGMFAELCNLQFRETEVAGLTSPKTRRAAPAPPRLPLYRGDAEQYLGGY